MVAEWLRAAGEALDMENKIAATDLAKRPGATGGARYPYYRTTGMLVLVKIKYTNGGPSFTPESGINAEIAVERQFLPWAGPGSTDRVHIQYPTGEYGNTTFEYVDRCNHKHDARTVFDFVPPPPSPPLPPLPPPLLLRMFASAPLYLCGVTWVINRLDSHADPLFSTAQLALRAVDACTRRRLAGDHLPVPGDWHGLLL